MNVREKVKVEVGEYIYTQQGRVVGGIDYRVDPRTRCPDDQHSCLILNIIGRQSPFRHRLGEQHRES